MFTLLYIRCSKQTAAYTLLRTYWCTFTDVLIDVLTSAHTQTHTHAGVHSDVHTGELQAVHHYRQLTCCGVGRCVAAGAVIQQQTHLRAKRNNYAIICIEKIMM